MPDQAAPAVYYHSCPLPLSVGSIIQPGNWGRLINQYLGTGQHGSPWIIAREMAFETVRVAKYPHLPSRFACAYVFDTLQTALDYYQAQTPLNILYAVELVNPEARFHRSDIRLINLPADNLQFLPAVMSAAESYWSGQNVEQPEILTESPLRIVELVNGSPAGFAPTYR